MHNASTTFVYAGLQHTEEKVVDGASKCLKDAFALDLSSSMSEQPGTLGPIYTMNEAAARMRISRRALQELIKRHPFYFPNGRRKLFTEDDLANLVAALREDGGARRRANSFAHTPEVRAESFKGHIPGSMWAEAQRRLAALQQQRPTNPRKKKSS
jgi:excisionase family DNA binding protein